MKEQEKLRENPLGILPVRSLLMKFTVPSIVAMLTSALYNIVDQYFIGNSVGELGNAATNIAFPLTTCCIAIALLFGIGGAAAFNLAKGAGDDEKAVYYMGNAMTGMFALGTLLFLVTQLFLDPMLRFFGAPESIMGYARTYVRITSIGFPMIIFASGGGHLIRADGSPNFSMLCNIVGAVINTVLDALFVFGFRMGMAGAALATIIGQFVSCLLAMYYLSHCKTVTVQARHLRLHKKYVSRVASLGAAPCSNQLAMMVVQLVMNKSLTYYGGQSNYGEEVPLACAGIISKVNQVYFSFIIGLSQGLQPIISFNYGAGKYGRAKKAFLTSAAVGFVISTVAFVLFQAVPRQIIEVFGEGSEEYIAFSVSYFRVFLFFTFLNFLQPLTSNCFTAIGKPLKGMFLSLTRQIIFLLPLIVALPLAVGIDGILYAGPVADGMAAAVSFVFIARELAGKKYREDAAVA
ncbi:MAG: MATE family efflux transporter [Lachnospiraceae bacterium]|nr:MATE family efflux transporter [Lachnospiraceae bacterium]